MEYLIISIIVVIMLIIIKFILNITFKNIKKIVENNKLDEVIKNYPNNLEICKWCLKKLNNEGVTIEEDDSAQNCLYIAVTNKILIANIKDTYTRVQTVAHECLHSIQGKKLLSFNFIYSNIYLFYTFIITVLAIFNVLPYKLMFLSILIFLSMVYILIRNYLENDAMIKAKYLAKEYMEDVKISSKEEIDYIISEYDRINEYGIKGTNYKLFFNTCVKIIIFSLICFIRIVAF